MALSITSFGAINFKQPPHSLLKVSVIIPAKDEVSSICGALDALCNQVDDSGVSIPWESFEVLVLANNCNDGTFEVCTDYQNAHPLLKLSVENIQLAPDLANIGTVRRMLMDAAYERLMSVSGERGVIISTDADSEVDSQWIFQILKEIDNGADLVGGRILARGATSLSRAHHLRDVTYRSLRARLECEIDPSPINPWPRHHQCFGASLAVTCSMYERAGRLPMVPYLEDEAFRSAANRIDANIRNSPKVIVYTSSRLAGKVAVGFSGQLKEWEKLSLSGGEQMEESFESVRSQFLMKNKVRKLWLSTKKEGFLPNIGLVVATELAMNFDHFSAMLTAHEYFEGLWEQLYQNWVHARPNSIVMQPVVEAISDFRKYFGST